MGIADAIPGVSGGTIAFITGIYDRLLHAINSLRGRWLNLFFQNLFFQRNFKQALAALGEIHFSFLIPLGLGIILSLYFFSGIVNKFLTSYPALTFSFFFGLIAASIWLLFQKVKMTSFHNALSLLCGFVIAYLIAGATAAAVSHSLLVIFFSAALAICAMILPGISGAFVLLLLGQYQFLLQSLQEFNLPVIFTFAMGALLGLLSFVKLLDYILHHYRAVTMSFLVGLMIGSLRIPFVSIAENGGVSLFVLLSGAAGFILVLILEKIFHQKD